MLPKVRGEKLFLLFFQPTEHDKADKNESGPICKGERVKHSRKRFECTSKPKGGDMEIFSARKNVLCMKREKRAISTQFTFDESDYTFRHGGDSMKTTAVRAMKCLVKVRGRNT